MVSGRDSAMRFKRPFAGRSSDLPGSSGGNAFEPAGQWPEETGRSTDETRHHSISRGDPDDTFPGTSSLVTQRIIPENLRSCGGLARRRSNPETIRETQRWRNDNAKTFAFWDVD